MTFLEQKVRETPQDIALGGSVMDETPRAQAINEKCDKWDHIKFRSFCMSNYKTEWRESFQMKKKMYLQAIYPTRN